ncbi:hypothetical protein D5282_15130 [bacterium 1xD8-48]|jgi:hypothetical protein|nr:hypothetical protein [Lachnospiraceae bacterium]MCI9327522.1 hypothetical protein [Lachnospiraceae bacterium]NBJ98612.1 hypothetical protein [bacterium 1xD8-48]
MTTLLVARQYIKTFISKYEVYLKPLMKLVIALAAMMMLNGKIGYMHRLDSISIVLIIALMCSFMPMNFIIFVSALFMILHLYALSMECAAIMLVIFLVMFLLYFRFSPKDALVVILTPMCFALKIPYVMPLAMGLLGTPASAVSVGCGVVVSFLIGHVTDNATAIMSMDSDDMATRFRFIIDSFLDNKEMLFTIAAFAVTITVVYLIRRMSVDYAWTIAIIAGALTDVVLLLVGDLMFDTNVSFGGIIIGTIIAVLIAKVVEFFSFNLDYSRTEKVQFEDDEYYYYVKAIPKFTVSTPSRTVKRINATRKHSSGSHPKNNN